jgi:2-polyprenyl-3-methyl-5-hydroxy-6-metoxy-1,4-benzoquinol methylase
MNRRYGARRAPALGIGYWVLPLAFPLWQQLDFFYRHLPHKPGSLLDVGCGNGVFLLRAREAGWNVAGVEPDSAAVATARAGDLDVWNGTLDDYPHSSTYDVVTASHVLEHVHDPRLFLRQISMRLRPGGTIWLATPNVRSLGHCWYGRSWRGLEPPRHLTIFSSRALRSLLEGVGFSSIRFHRRGRGSRYILDSSLELARRADIDVHRLPPWLVDMAASVVAAAAEELVVSAKLELP